MVFYLSERLAPDRDRKCRKRQRRFRVTQKNVIAIFTSSFAMRLTEIAAALCILSVSVSAEVWHDDFEVENPEAWQVVGNSDIWKIADGFLRAEVKREWELDYELYRFQALPAPYTHFTVTLNDIGTDRTRFGFALGKSFPDTPEDDAFFYVFFMDEIRARRFDGKGRSHPFRLRVSREPRTRWDTEALTQLELHFRVGHFEVYADGEFRTEFRDANFDKIEILGFVMEGINIANEWEGTAWVDAFTIAGPTLAVVPKAKLATTWGRLKKGFLSIALRSDR